MLPLTGSADVVPRGGQPNSKVNMALTQPRPLHPYTNLGRTQEGAGHITDLAQIRTSLL